MKKKSGYILLALFVFSGLLLSFQQANAFFDVIPALASMQLDALDFLDHVVAYLFYLLLLALGGTVFILFSATLLDWASSIPVGLTDNLLVNAGWGFLSGLVNIIFILILVAIALSYIFKVETFGMKKALPRLIIIAFLLNFSLLFVKIFVDLGSIVQNAFQQAFWGSEGLALPIARQVADSLGKVVAGYITGFFAPYFVTALIPFANVARLIFLGTTFLGSEVFFGTFSQAVILTAFGIIGGLIFFTYAILFLLRIAVIWLLAIAAPLAFAAYILPQTQKFFHQWLKALFQWVFLGVVVFFLMGLGLKFFTVVAPTTAFSARGFNFVAEYSKFIFLIIYLLFCLQVAKKFTPTAASAVWSVGEMAVGAGTGFLASRARRWALKSGAWQKERAAKKLEGLSRQEFALQRRLRTEPMPTAERKILAEEFKGWREKRLVKKEMFEAQAQTLRGIQIHEQRNKLLAKTKGMDETTQKAWLSAEALKHAEKPEKIRDKSKSAALLELLAEKEAIKESHKNLYEEAWRGAGPEDWKKNRIKKAVFSRMPSWATDAELGGVKEKWNTGIIEKWDNSAKEDNRIIETVIGTHRADLITRLGASTGKASEKVQTKINETIGKAWKDLMAATNKMAYMSSLSNEKQKKLLKQLEVARHLHYSYAGEVQSWEKYGSIDKADRRTGEYIDDHIKALRKLIK